MVKVIWLCRRYDTDYYDIIFDENFYLKEAEEAKLIFKKLKNQKNIIELYSIFVSNLLHWEF